MFGERNQGAKLKASDIPEILRLHKQGYTHAAIGNIYGISDVQSGNIVRRKCWRHVKVPQ